MIDFGSISDSEPCSCRTCVYFFETAPCWVTPGEAIGLISAGFGDSLMLDAWIPDDDIPEGVLVLSAAIISHESGTSPYSRVGKCSFLNDNGLCAIHGKLKPKEGRVAHHD